MLMVGFGVFSYIGGTIFASALAMRLLGRFDSSGLLRIIVLGTLIEGTWVMLVLPAIAYFASRFMELKPWSTAIIGAMSGSLFQFALQYVISGEEGIVSDPARLATRFGVLIAGVFITATAAKRGREAANVAEVAAQRAAEAKKTQYDEFVKQSEALADRREQVPIAASTDVAAPPKPDGAP
jgi:hypothetical protein